VSRCIGFPRKPEEVEARPGKAPVLEGPGGDLELVAVQVEGVDCFVKVVDDYLYDVISDNNEGIYVPVYDRVDIISSCGEGREQRRDFSRSVGDVVEE
jgi:hypothetical protein